MKKILVMFNWDCGRQGWVDGLFVTTQEELDKAIGKRVYFGEILGKHSEIEGKLRLSDIKIESDDQDFIEKLVKVIGSDTISGHNPLHYISDEE